MKTSYKRIIITLSIYLLFLLLNLFIFKFSNPLILTISTLLVLGALIYQLGYEKGYFYKEKDIILNLLIYIVSYFILTYLLGIFTGFTRNSYNITPTGILKNIISPIIFIISSEILRYEILKKGSKNNIVLFLSIIVFIILDISLYINHLTLKDSSLLKLLILVLIPSIFKNIFLSYLVSKSSYRTSQVYRIILELKMYILPIFPGFGIYIESIINILFSSILFYSTYRYFNLKNIRKIRRKEDIKFYQIFIYSTVFLIAFSTMLLSSGLFKYSIFSIGSESMKPLIDKGDVIIYEKLKNNNKKNIKTKDIILFHSSSKVISHRIIKIKNINGTNYYYTKGDNNEQEDFYPVLESDIIGVYKFRIKYIGYPSVMLGELFNKRPTIMCQ